VKTIGFQYCKKSNHTLEEYQKWIHVNGEKEQEKHELVLRNESTLAFSGKHQMGQIKTDCSQSAWVLFSKQN